MPLFFQQQQALERIKNFIQNKDVSVFILKGYAGTGKTTMIKQIIPEIHTAGKVVSLMAPTGRAAKVLKEKTGFPAYTIHRSIYEFDKMQVVRHDEDGNLILTDHVVDKPIRSKGSDDLQFWFDIKKHDINEDPSQKIIIVDESSMIGSREVNSETLHFGTDRLIDDLLTYARLNLGGKLIFVGDSAQLPPVGDNCSVALDEKFFESRGLSVQSFELSEVVRQDESSAILSNAMKVRTLLKEKNRNSLVFERKAGEVEDAIASTVVESFCSQSAYPEIGKSIIVCYTNALVKDYNDAIRKIYFPTANHIVAGDIVQIVKNIVNEKLGIEFYNGDFAKVLEVSESLELQSAPVWTDAHGGKERVVVSVGFRDAVLLAEDGRQVRCKIVDTLLDSRSPNLSPLEQLALYINFRMRYPNLKNNEELFKDTLMSDPYFNAVQIKYGYAITGHKSQGGEWETAFVDYTGREGLNNDSLRWMYTATTRAAKRLFGVNMPNVTPLSKMSINPVNKISKISHEAYSYAEVGETPFLPAGAELFRRAKCISIQEHLSESGFRLSGVLPFQYQDKYVIDTPRGSVVFQCWYNGAKQFTKYLQESPLSENEQIASILKDESNIRYEINYLPANDSLQVLYNKITSICDDLDIRITNVVEHLNQYYVMYFFKTTGLFSQMQFYFDRNFKITHALPASETGINDEKLNNLIDRLR